MPKKLNEIEIMPNYVFDLANPLRDAEVRKGDIYGIEQIPGDKASVAAFEVLSRDPGSKEGVYRYRRLSDGLIGSGDFGFSRFYPAREISAKLS
jgi:hypothetical protein